LVVVVRVVLVGQVQAAVVAVVVMYMIQIITFLQEHLP
jgi:hypothetical protein